MGIVKKIVRNVVHSAATSLIDNFDSKFTCNTCGANMRQEDDETYICPVCGSHYDYDGDEWTFTDYSEDEEYEEIYTGPGKRPAICTGCGSDMWPDCQYSCKRCDN